MKKLEYFEFLSLFKNKFPNSEFKIVKKLEKHYMLTKTKYGLCKSSIHHLLNGKIPSIRSALNKTEYFINQAKEIHGDRYDYSLTKFEISNKNIQYICKIHGNILQSPGCHLSGRGCNKCKYNIISIKNSQNESGGYNLSNWKQRAEKSKYFDSFKVYIIECWNDEEVFYKIGRTFTTVEKRFIKIPYNYKIIKIFENKVDTIYQLEIDLKNKNKYNKYLPKIWFSGSKECFNKIEDIENEFNI